MADPSRYDHIKQPLFVRVYVGKTLLAEVESKELGLFLLAAIEKSAREQTQRPILSGENQ